MSCRYCDIEWFEDMRSSFACESCASSEEWKVFPYCPELSISNLGRYRNDKTGTILRFDYMGRPHCRYLCLRFRAIGRRVSIAAHKAVFIAFHGEIPEGYQVDHIDNYRFNNRPGNLQLLSHMENQEKRPYLKSEAEKLIDVILGEKEVAADDEVPF